MNVLLEVTLELARQSSPAVLHVTICIYIPRVSNRKYESIQNQSTAVFPSRSTIGKIETIPQMGMTLKMFAPNAILNQQC